MLSVDTIRSDPRDVERRLAQKGWAGDLAAVLDLDERRREHKEALARLAEQRRGLAHGSTDRGPGDGLSAETQVKGRRIRAEIRQAKQTLVAIERELESRLLALPNLPDPSVAPGDKPAHDTCLAQHGSPEPPGFVPSAHHDLLAALGLADFGAGARAASAGFVCITGAGAALTRALASFMIDTHVRELGAVEVSPPLLVNQDAVFGSGHLLAEPQGMYRCQDLLFVSPAAEASILGMHKGRSIPRERLPLTYVAHTPCFRRDIGSAGAANRGLLRLHQFDKVEIVRFMEPGDAAQALVPLLTSAERVLAALGLRYRLMELCAGRLSFAASKAVEVDAYAPGMARWLTLGACRYYGDFQARRLHITVRPRTGRAGTALVHTASMTAVALPRTLAALVETHQQPDGTVQLPEVLCTYTGGQQRLSLERNPAV